MTCPSLTAAVHAFHPAAPGEAGTLPRWKAWTWFATCVLGLALAATFLQEVSLANLVPFDGGPDALSAKARAVLRSLGYTRAPHDYARWMTISAGQRRMLVSRDSLG